jgi:hypothetical protein
MIKPTLLGTSFKPFSLSRDRTIYFPSLKSLTYAAAAFTLYCAVHKQPGRRSTSKSAAASEAQRSRDVADGPVLVPACRGGTGTGQNDRAEKLRLCLVTPSFLNLTLCKKKILYHIKLMVHA